MAKRLLDANGYFKTAFSAVLNLLQPFTEPKGSFVSVIFLQDFLDQVLGFVTLVDKQIGFRQAELDVRVLGLEFESRFIFRDGAIKVL